MKTVQKACPVCRGIGYVSWINTTVNATENTVSATSKICPHCGGKCLCGVPMTNADRIQGMDDNELAEFLMECNPANCQQCAFSFGWRCDPDREDYSDAEKCTEGRKRWLQQPAEEAQ